MTLTQTLRFSPEEYRGKRLTISIEEGHIVDVDVVDDHGDGTLSGTHGLSGNLTILGAPDQPFDARGVPLGYTIAHEGYGEEERQNHYTVAFGDDVRHTFEGDRTFIVAFGPTGAEDRYPDAYTVSVMVDFDDEYYDDEEEDA